LFFSFTIIVASRYELRRLDSMNNYYTKSLEFGVHPYRKLLLMCLSRKILIESQFFNELYCRCWWQGQDDTWPRTVHGDLLWGCDVERSIHLATRSEIKARAIVIGYLWICGGTISTENLVYISWNISALNISVRVIFSLGIRGRQRQIKIRHKYLVFRNY